MEKFNDIFRSILVQKFYEIIFGVDKNKYKSEEFINNIGKLNLENSEEKFFVLFSESQMFINRFLNI